MNYKNNPSNAFFFYKNVLRKVSFDSKLFVKELNKAVSVLSKQEGVWLYRWAMTFSTSQPELYLSLSLVD
jgi:hypothetical protein